MPAPTNKLCWWLLSVFTFIWGIPDQKSLASPRKLNLEKSLTSSPKPAWNAPVMFPAVLKLEVELLLKRPNPPPTLTHGETACVGKTFSRAAGVTKKDW